MFENNFKQVQKWTVSSVETRKDPNFSAERACEG